MPTNPTEISRRNLFSRSGLPFLVALVGACNRQASDRRRLQRPSDARGEESSSDRLPPTTQPFIDIVVRPIVVPIRQVSDNTCWAAVWTMLLSWREGQRLSIEQAVRRLGPEWVERLKKDEGLAAQTFTEQAFLNASGLHFKPPMNFLPSAYVELLASHGPLWINTGNGILNHAMLLVSAQTTRDQRITFRFADPLVGGFVTKSDETFFADFEREARFIGDHKLKWDLRFQIFYW